MCQHCLSGGCIVLNVTMLQLFMYKCVYRRYDYILHMTAGKHFNTLILSLVPFKMEWVLCCVVFTYRPTTEVN